MERYSKAIGGFIGALIPVLALFFEVPDFLKDPQTIAVISTVLATIGVYVAPKNAE